jgi:protein gp37
MGDKTTIEWTDATWNPVTGCTKVSQGCKHCYAERVFPRTSARQQVIEPSGERRERRFTDVWTHENRLNMPLRLRKPRRIFVNSMSDLFHEDVPFGFVERVFVVIEGAPQHTFQILTKRPERMRAFMQRWADQRGVPANAWLGVSVEDQSTADERIPLLIQTPAAVRWISAEPLLGPINLYPWACMPELMDKHGEPFVGLDWVVVGGESGPKARPMHPDWARSLRDQCVDAGVPFLFKQWGEFLPCGMPTDQPHDTNRSPPGGEVDGHRFVRIGKRAAGRLLDSRTWDEYPA